MKQHHVLPKEQFVKLLEEGDFEHLTSSIHVMNTDASESRQLAGVSLYSNPNGYMAQINWQAELGDENVTIRVGDAERGEPAYQIRDGERKPVQVYDGNSLVPDDEFTTIVSRSSLAEAWQQDAVNLLRESGDQEATVH